MSSIFNQVNFPNISGTVIQTKILHYVASRLNSLEFMERIPLCQNIICESHQSPSCANHQRILILHYIEHSRCLVRCQINSLTLNHDFPWIATVQPTSDNLHMPDFLISYYRTDLLHLVIIPDHRKLRAITHLHTDLFVVPTNREYFRIRQFSKHSPKSIPSVKVSSSDNQICRNYVEIVWLGHGLP